VGPAAWAGSARCDTPHIRSPHPAHASIIWEGHKSGREIGYCQIEKLSNLDQLPPTGFTVICFPVKVKAGSAGWTRAVAVIDA
jgi:kynurenine formamidase